MSARIVVLGGNLDGVARCLTINAMDAGALLAERRGKGQGARSVSLNSLIPLYRVCVAQYAGPLSDATVIQATEEYLDSLGGAQEREAHEEAWRRLLARPFYKPVESLVPVPVPMGEHPPVEVPA